MIILLINEKNEKKEKKKSWNQNDQHTNITTTSEFLKNEFPFCHCEFVDAIQRHFVSSWEREESEDVIRLKTWAKSNTYVESLIFYVFIAFCCSFLYFSPTIFFIPFEIIKRETSISLRLIALGTIGSDLIKKKVKHSIWVFRECFGFFCVHDSTLVGLLMQFQTRLVFHRHTQKIMAPAKRSQSEWAREEEI